MSQALILAVPSKGRLLDPVQTYFADAGLRLVQGGEGRDYAGALAHMPGVTVRYLSASEIAAALIAGHVHLGITGEDLLRETAANCEPPVALLQPLGFGHADVVVAVPEAWVDVGTMHDLDDVCVAFHVRHRRRLKVATKYHTLTRRFFREKGLSDYLIVDSVGATEGAPAAGTAEAIVDITSSGATLKANRLKVLNDGVILRSQAHLAASRAAHWPEATCRLARTLIGRLAARQAAKGALLLRLSVPSQDWPEMSAWLAQCGAHILESTTDQTVLATALVRESGIGALQSAGPLSAKPMALEKADYLFLPDAPLLKALEAVWV